MAAEPFASEYESVRRFTMVPPESCWTLSQLATQALSLPGDVMEAGVYKGGTARLLANRIRDRQLYLFDSFEGMRETTTADRHKAGDFADTSLEAVSALVPEATLVKGWVPDTFVNLDLRLCFAHIDLDLYRSVLDCLDYVYPRLIPGGVIVLDDYGYASCPGARQAVDEFFIDKRERPLVLQTGQAIVTRL